jgi:hypothetical protein
VAMAELGTHSATERAGLETLGLTSARPSSIPTRQERARATECVWESSWTSLDFRVFEESIDPVAGECERIGKLSF